MPGMIKSKAQLRKLFALGARGELKGGTAKAEEMAHEEGHKRLSKLPEYKASGGMIGGCPRCGYAPGDDEDSGLEEGQEPIGAYEPDEPHEHEPMVLAMRKRGR